MNKLLVKIIRFFMVLYAKLPLKFHYFMADVFAWLVKDVLKYRADVIWVNLARSFPEKKYRELKKIGKDFYTHLGEIIAEAIWFGGCSYEKLRKHGIVTVMNPEVISEAYEKAPSVTILSTHCGNWELLGGLLGYNTATGGKICFGEESISVVYKQLNSKVANDIFALNRISPLEVVGTECEVESKSILRYIIANKNEKRVYIYPTDQSPYKKSGKHDLGIFMNQDTKSMLGSVGIASKLSHAVVYMKMKRVKRGSYEMSFIPICENASVFTPEEIMRKYYDLLEEEIRETPHNWLWSHKRWK